MHKYKVIGYTLSMHKYLPFIREKKEVIDAYQAVESPERRGFERWSKLEFIFTANYLEGSTLSRAESMQVVEKGLTVGGRTLKEQNNAVMLGRAVDWMRNSAKRSRHDIDEHVLITLHHLPNLDESVDGFVKYSYQVPYVLTEYSEWLHQQNGLEVEVAVAAHIKLLQVKPFKDDNDKTARLLLNLLLLQAGYPLSLIREDIATAYIESTEAVLSGNGGINELTDLLFESVDYSLDKYLASMERRVGARVGELLKIGELAKMTNETIPTIRHWTKSGLLAVAEYSKGGYQLYDPSMAEMVVKIRQLQREQKMTIEEIRQTFY